MSRTSYLEWGHHIPTMSCQEWNCISVCACMVNWSRVTLRPQGNDCHIPRPLLSTKDGFALRRMLTLHYSPGLRLLHSTSTLVHQWWICIAKNVCSPPGSTFLPTCELMIGHRRTGRRGVSLIDQGKCMHKLPIHKHPVEHMGRGRALFSCSAHAR